MSCLQTSHGNAASTTSHRFFSRYSRSAYPDVHYQMLHPVKYRTKTRSGTLYVAKRCWGTVMADGLHRTISWHASTECFSCRNSLMHSWRGEAKREALQADYSPGLESDNDRAFCLSGFRRLLTCDLRPSSEDGLDESILGKQVCWV